MQKYWHIACRLFAKIACVDRMSPNLTRYRTHELPFDCTGSTSCLEDCISQ
jgi:hypothetical protein